MFALIGSIVAPVVEGAQIQRTFVSGSGSDSNPCTLSFPCRQFSSALANTLPGGELLVLDSAGYGPLTITKAVAIVVPSGVYAGVSVFSGVGISVNAGAGNKVTLRGLTVTGLGGTIGISFASGDALYLDNVTVSGFGGGSAIDASVGSAASALFIRDSAIRDNAIGLHTATTSGSLTLKVERSVFERNGTGASIGGNARGSIHGSTFAAGATGLTAGSAGQTAKVALRDCTISDNSAAGAALSLSGTTTTVTIVSSLVAGNALGIQSTNSGNIVYSSDNTITRNTTGVQAAASGTIVSGGDNRLVDNGADGTFSSSLGKM